MGVWASVIAPNAATPALATARVVRHHGVFADCACTTRVSMLRGMPEARITATELTY